MRARLLGIAGLLVLLAGILAFTLSDRLAMAQDATPVASPEATEETATDAETAATPEASQNIVTLVAWYGPDETGDLLMLSPIRTSPTYVASAGEATEQDLSGTVNFTEERNKGGLPRIRLGDSIFDAAEIVDGDRDSVQRWLFYNGEDGARPATLVMQITADQGPYEGATGTATFISRADDSTGVLVIVLYLPES
jgi:hypothetical protein